VKDRGATVEANRVFEDLRAMVRWARARGDLDQNFVEGMRRPADSVIRDRVLSPDEIRAFWGRLPDAKMQEGTRRILRLCLVTAARVGEVAGMTTDELDLERRVWTIPAARSKNKRQHGVPLSDFAVELIAEQLTEIREAAAQRDRRMARRIARVSRGSGRLFATKAGRCRRPPGRARLATRDLEAGRGGHRAATVYLRRSLGTNW
jgi:integrase